MTTTTTPAPQEPSDNTPQRPLPVGDNVRRSWNYSLQDIRGATVNYSKEGQQALVEAFLWCIDPRHPVRQEDFARRVGYSVNTLYKLYTGKYRDESGQQLDAPEKLVKAISEFLALEKERHAGGRNEFVMTPTARRIWTACDLARESQTPVFITGPSHIGKTWALEAYTTDNNHGRTIYIRMKAASGLGGMVRRIATCLGISDRSNTANLLDYIRRGLTSDMLLIFDEVHLLQYTYRLSSFFACMEVLRELYDESGCGMVFCGTRLLLEKMKAGEHQEMEQLMRRGVHRFPLPNAPTKADMAAILKFWALDFPERGQKIVVKHVEEQPYEILRQLCRVNGLKAITERLRYARKLAVKRGSPLTWEHFVEAHLIIASQSQADETGGWE